MKVLMINGSPHAKGNTYIALHEMEKIFAEEGIETEILHIGNKDIRGCIACHSCAQNGKCVFDDLVNETAPKFKECDGLVVASPVYYASANATLVAFLDRLFYSTSFDKTMKVGASVVAARRGGLSSTFDELNKYFTICGMPVASGQYWNSIHGREPGEAQQGRAGGVLPEGGEHIPQGGEVFALDQGPHPLHLPLLQLHPGGHIPEEAGVAQLHMEP